MRAKALVNASEFIRMIKPFAAPLARQLDDPLRQVMTSGRFDYSNCPVAIKSVDLKSATIGGIEQPPEGGVISYPFIEFPDLRCPLFWGTVSSEICLGQDHILEAIFPF